jgi:hypothetical protein
VAILGPLAYYPTYLLYEPAPHTATFWQRWLALGVWPAGPVWFLWVLLLFDLGATVATMLVPGWGAALGRLTGRWSAHPARFHAALVVVSALAYVPLAVLLDPGRWVVAGPFWIQISRVLLYAVYFVAGVGLGAYGIERGLLAADGRLAMRWAAWMPGAGAALGALGAAQLGLLAAADRGGAGPVLVACYALVIAVFCATVSMVWLGLYLRFARTDSGMLARLDANSYGIFVLHYVFVTWLQLALLAAPLPAAAKALLVFLGAVALAGTTTAALRRIPAVPRVL